MARQKKVAKFREEDAIWRAQENLITQEETLRGKPSKGKGR